MDGWTGSSMLQERGIRHWRNTHISFCSALGVIGEVRSGLYESVGYVAFIII